jgi:hypothetical protein
VGQDFILRRVVNPPADMPGPDRVASGWLCASLGRPIYNRPQDDISPPGTVPLRHRRRRRAFRCTLNPAAVFRGAKRGEYRMPLLPSNLPKDIDTPNGSLKFTSNGIVLAHPNGTKVVIGPTGIELSCGSTSIKLGQSDILVSSATASLKLAPGECILTAAGPMKLNAAILNVNNGALEVF